MEKRRSKRQYSERTKQHRGSAVKPTETETVNTVAAATLDKTMHSDNRLKAVHMVSCRRSKMVDPSYATDEEKLLKYVQYEYYARHPKNQTVQ